MAKKPMSAKKNHVDVEGYTIRLITAATLKLTYGR